MLVCVAAACYITGSAETMASESSTTSYCSTRGGAKGVSFEDVVLGGLAEDRGLYVPETLPSVSLHELSEVST